MFSGPGENFIIGAWEEITALSGKERFERSGGTDKRPTQIVKYLPTLSNLQIWMDVQPWHVSPVSKEDALYYLAAFHSEMIKHLRQ